MVRTPSNTVIRHIFVHNQNKDICLLVICFQATLSWLCRSSNAINSCPQQSRGCRQTLAKNLSNPFSCHQLSHKSSASEPPPPPLLLSPIPTAHTQPWGAMIFMKLLLLSIRSCMKWKKAVEWWLRSFYCSSIHELWPADFLFPLEQGFCVV